MLKFIFTLLIGLIGFSPVYASFPVTANENTLEEVDLITSPVTDTPLGDWSLIMGLAWFPLIICSIIFSLDGYSEESVIFCLIAGIASFIGAIITGITSLRRGEKPKWKAYVGLGLTLGIILLSIIAPLLEEIPFY